MILIHKWHSMCYCQYFMCQKKNRRKGYRITNILLLRCLLTSIYILEVWGILFKKVQFNYQKRWLQTQFGPPVNQFLYVIPNHIEDIIEPHLDCIGKISMTVGPWLSGHQLSGYLYYLAAILQFIFVYFSVVSIFFIKSCFKNPPQISVLLNSMSILYEW